MTDQNYISSPGGTTPSPDPRPQEPVAPQPAPTVPAEQFAQSSVDGQALAKMQEALKAAQDASSLLANATQEASSVFESYSRETQDILEQRAKALLIAIEAEKEKEEQPVSTEVSSQTGQIYFTTTISNIEPPKQTPPTPQAPPAMPYVPTLETSQMTAVTPPVNRPDDSGLDVDTPPGYTDATQFSRSGFFTEGTTTDLDMAQDFSSLEVPKKPTPNAPYYVYLILGSVGAIIASWLVFTIPEAKPLEASTIFLPLVIVAVGFVAVGLLMWLPIWLVSRGRTPDHKGLFARAFLRAALCTTLVTFLWIEALVISDMFRLGQLSL